MKVLFLFLVMCSVIVIVLGYIGIELFYSFNCERKAIKAEQPNESEIEDLKDYKYSYKNIKEGK